MKNQGESANSSYIARDYPFPVVEKTTAPK
jgi:hypothetical protein